MADSKPPTKAEWPAGPIAVPESVKLRVHAELHCSECPNRDEMQHVGHGFYMCTECGQEVELRQTKPPQDEVECPHCSGAGLVRRDEL